MAKWTKDQEEAISARGGNLLVAAAAGSGKTAVLVERIIQRICDEEDPVDVDGMLVVTFTNLAAAEMKERIGIAINKALKDNPLSKNLYRQSTLLNKASITTLHSFCLEIIRENFYRIGIDPNFRIADDTEAQLLRLDVLEDLLETYYQEAQDGDDFLNLIDAYGGQRDDASMQDLIIKLYQFSRSNPWPNHWLDRVAEEFDNGGWFEGLLPSLAMELEGARTLLKQCHHYALSPRGPAPYVENLQEELHYLEDLINSSKQSWQELYETFPQGGFARLPRVKKGTVDENLQERVKALREKAKGKVKEIQGKYFSRSSQEMLADLTSIKPHLTILCQLVKDFEKGYKEQKSKRNLVDFNDLEHFCLQILMAEESKPGMITPSQVSTRLKERFAEVLVDEYQDINDVQETLLSLVSKDDNLFMVGDVKQSIYRFRLAKPELFLNKYQSFDLAPQAINRRIDLAMNFRCSQDIVRGVNYIFCQMMTPEVGEISYDEKAQLVYGANLLHENQEEIREHPVEFCLLEKKVSEEFEDDLTPLDREAEIMGQQILQMIQDEFLVFDKQMKQYRPIAYRDMVILLRSPKGMVEKVIERFHHLGIPIYAEMGSGYFSAIEVQTILALLKVIDNPRQDIPLAAVLRSPIVGLTVHELAQIRLNAPKESFYQAVVQTSLMGESSLAQKVKEFLEKLENWRTIARQSNLADLIWTVYRETGYLDYMGSMVGGVQRQANLRALHDRARQYEATTFRGLFRFLRFLERLEENKGDIEGAKALSENENVVRVMSIHKSKGLEFPVVFVAGLGKKFNLRDGQQDVVIHKDLGLGPVFIDAEKRIKYPTIAKLAIENKIKLETLAEEMRILYVSLTRAKEKLILVGSVNDLGKSIENWCEILAYRGDQLPDSELVQGRTFLDWLGPALVRHKGAGVLRETMELAEDSFLVEDSTNWQVKIFPEGVFSSTQEQVAVHLEALEDVKELRAIDSSLLLLQQEVDQKLSWRYPYSYLIAKGAKVTVSEIKHKFHGLSQEEDFKLSYGFSKRPLFMQKNKGLSAGEKGSALHLVMENVDLTKTIDTHYLNELLAFLEGKEILTQEQRAIVDQKYLLDFFESPLGQRLQKASKVKREVPFSLAVPAGEIYDFSQDQETEEKVLIQGMIDCMWWEEDGWILLDYKSDAVKEKEVQEVIEKYKGQINLYTQAIERILKEPVKERYIYLFHLNKGILIKK